MGMWGYWVWYCCWLFVLYICCCCAPAAAADGTGGEEAYSEESFPNPMKDFQACGVQDVSYICDPSHALSEHEMKRLNSIIESLRNVETCLCDKKSDCRRASRHRIMVALVPRIKYTTGGFPDTEDTERAAARQFAEYLRDTSWFITDGSCSMHAYIVHDMYTKRVWTSTNYYAIKVITNDRAGEVAKAAKAKYFKYDMAFAGIQDMIIKYRQFLENGPPGMAWWKILLIVLGCLSGVGLIVGFIFCCIHGDCEGGGGGGGGVWRGGSYSPGGGCGGSGCGGGGGGGGGCGGGGGD